MERPANLEFIITCYKAEIEEILTESENVYRSTINYEILDIKLDQLLETAKKDGVNEKIVWDLIHARIPSYINYKNSNLTRKKAA